MFKAELLSGIVYSQKIIKKILEEVEEMLRLEESSTYRMIIEKGLREGIEKGIKEGLKKTILKQLNKKLKGLPKKYEQMIKDADSDILDKIAEDIFDIEKPEDLDKYF